MGTLRAVIRLASYLALTGIALAQKCNNTLDEQRRSLETLYDASGGSGWTNQTRWLDSPLPRVCSTRANGSVTVLEVSPFLISWPVDAAGHAMHDCQKASKLDCAVVRRLHVAVKGARG